MVLLLLTFCSLLLPLLESVCSMFCCTLLYVVHSSIAIILLGKRELVALLNLSSWCLVMVARLFLAVPLGCLRFVIVVFPDHTHLQFMILSRITKALIRLHGCACWSALLLLALQVIPAFSRRSPDKVTEQNVIIFMCSNN